MNIWNVRQAPFTNSMLLKIDFLLLNTKFNAPAVYRPIQIILLKKRSLRKHQIFAKKPLYLVMLSLVLILIFVCIWFSVFIFPPQIITFSPVFVFYVLKKTRKCCGQIGYIRTSSEQLISFQTVICKHIFPTEGVQ